MLEVAEYTGDKRTVIGKCSFDIAEYGPMLDQEPYASDPSHSLSKNLALSLEPCKYDENAKLQVVISLKIMKKNTSSST